MGNCISQVDNNKKYANDGPKRTELIMYSDFTCPYCYLEFVRLMRAMERLPEDQRLPVVHGPFQLDDSLSSEGIDKYEFLSSLIPPAALDPMIEDLGSQFRTLGMEMNPRGMMGNSAPAHRLMIWAEEQCPPDQAINLKHELFQIHCCIGKSMSDVAAIVEAAAKAGLTDEAKIRSVLKDSKYATKLKKLKRHAKEDLDIQSVPCLMVFEKSGNGRKLDEATGIETIEGFTQLLQQCSEKKKRKDGKK